MTFRIPLLLLAAAILLIPRPSASEPLDFLAPSTCNATGFSPELPFFSQPDSESQSKGFVISPRKCGGCAACQGLYADTQCGRDGWGRIKYCRDGGDCSLDGLAHCVCSADYV